MAALLGKLKDEYEGALLHNTGTLVAVESTLRQLTWFLPGRFSDSEVASEGIYSGLSLLTIYHDTILQTRIAKLREQERRSPFSLLQLEEHQGDETQAQAGSSHGTNGHSNGHSNGNGSHAPGNGFPAKLPDAGAADASAASKTTVLPPASDHYRFTRHFASSSSVYRHASRALAVVGYVQLLLEMLVRKRSGERKRWRLVAVLEAFKSTLRLILLRITRRPLLRFAMPLRELDPSQLTGQIKSEIKQGLQSETQARPSVIATLPSDLPPLQSHLIPLLSDLPERCQTSPSALIPELSSTREWLGEVMVATEGLVLVTALLWHGRQRRRQSLAASWSLSDLSTSSLTTALPLSWILIARLLRLPSSRLTPLLAETYNDRDRQLAFYFARGAIWTQYTRPKIQRVLDWAQDKRLIGMVAGLFKDHLRLVDDLYYYTST